METPENKTYLVEKSNEYGRHFQDIKKISEKEVTFFRLKGYNVWEVEKLNRIYVRKFK